MTAVDCITSQQRMRALLHEAVSHGRRKPAVQIRRAKSPQEDRTPQLNATFPIRDEDNFSVPPPKGYHVEDLEYRSEEEETSQAWVPLRIVKPLSALDRLPAIVYLHATGGNLEQMHGRMELAAQRGYLTAAIDCRYHGRRCSPGESGRHCYEDALVRAWRTGNERPFLLDNVWDLTILLDYLETRPDVDSSRIGMTGISLGGMHSWLTMALDDRVAVGAPMIGVQGFSWAAENDSWHARVGSIPRVFAAAAADLGKPAVDAGVVMAVWNRIMPGLLEGYDAPHSLPCLAPRPFLIANGELDPRCPVKGLTEALERTKAAYASAGSSENFQVFFQKGLGHSVSHELDAAVNAFLDKHLLQGQKHQKQVSYTQSLSQEEPF